MFKTERSKKRDALNLKHSANPKVGDYWSEMFCPCWVVIEVSKHSVVVCETTKKTDAHHWTWNLSKIKSYTRKEFAQKGRYNTESLKDKFFCEVSPGAHEWVTDAIGNEDKI